MLTIRSGGQTGVDRAALDAAMEQGLAVTGWCPAGRLAEDGRIPDRYPLAETSLADYAQRTRWNVRDSDATLILSRSPLAGGTALTAAIAEELGRPLLIVDPGAPVAADVIRSWVRRQRVGDLNVAGPRESEDPGIYTSALLCMRGFLRDHGDDPG